MQYYQGYEKNVFPYISKNIHWYNLFEEEFTKNVKCANPLTQ